MKMNNAYIEQQSVQTTEASAQRDELSAEEFNLVSGGYPCSYSGAHDYDRMMSYELRNYSC
jgi:hypothetical protein